jgi:hypothetical protein
MYAQAPFAWCSIRLESLEAFRCGHYELAFVLLRLEQSSGKFVNTTPDQQIEGAGAREPVGSAAVKYLGLAATGTFLLAAQGSSNSVAVG